MATEYAAGVRDAMKEMQPVIDELEDENATLKGVNTDLKDKVSRLHVILKEHGISDK